MSSTICKYTDSHTYLLGFEINKIISIILHYKRDTRCSVTSKDIKKEAQLVELPYFLKINKKLIIECSRIGFKRNQIKNSG